MSDPGRKSLTDQAGEKLKPDSQKTTMEKAGESVTNAADKVMGGAQGYQRLQAGNKSATQQASDSVRGGGSHTGSGTGQKGYMESAQDTLNDALKSVKGDKTHK